MNSRELCSYFLESLNQIGRSNSKLNENECAAILYGHDEVLLDKEKLEIRLPEIGSIAIGNGPDLKNINHFDWVALVKEGDVDAWSALFGCGNPYLPQNAPGLPTKNGTVIAVPFCLKEEIFSKNSASLKVGRNELCPCGSRKKFKKCCLH